MLATLVIFLREGVEAALLELGQGFIENPANGALRQGWQTVGESCPQTVDLIFSDIQMPGSMDGLELTRRVQERFGQIIVVLTSGRRSQRSTDHPHFLAKPYRLGNVTALIKSLLERKE